MTGESLDELREFASELAWLAGKVTLGHFQTGIVPDIKADNSPVTVADRQAERLVREMIERRYPGHSIVGEEEGETRTGSTFRWIVDPIDGTKSFVQGVPFYAVLIGLEREGESVVGAVNIPATGELLTASTGSGCWWNGRRASVSKVSTLAELMVACTDVRSMGRHGRAGAWRRIEQATRLQRTWGDAYGYVLVATGRAEFMLDPIMNLWDCAALLPVVEEAGGTFTDWSGKRTIDGGESIGTNGLVLDELLALIKDSD